MQLTPMRLLQSASGPPRTRIRAGWNWMEAPGMVEVVKAAPHTRSLGLHSTAGLHPEERTYAERLAAANNFYSG